MEILISQFPPTSPDLMTTVFLASFSGAGQMWSREKCDELAKEVVEQFDRVPVVSDFFRCVFGSGAESGVEIATEDKVGHY